MTSQSERTPRSASGKLRYSPTTSARLSTKVFRLLTAPLRVQPDFIIIGAQRSGTTSLFEYLVQHPSVLPGLYKEVRYFTDRWRLGPLYYRACSPTRGHMQQVRDRTGAAMTFEATPYYLFSPVALERIERTLPTVKLVAILRDPIARTISHYSRSVKLGHESLGLEEALRKEHERLARRPGESDVAYYDRPEVRQFSYLGRSLYGPQLRRIIDVVGRDRLHVMCFETLMEQPQSEFGNLLQFLGLPQCNSIRFEHHHKGQGVKPDVPADLLKWMHEQIAPSNAQLHEMFGDIFPWASG